MGAINEEKTMRWSRYLGLGAMVFACGVQAQTVGANDRRFLQNEAQGTAYELAIANLATQKAARQDIKDYAQMIVQDHSQLNTQLQQLAQSKGVSLPGGMTAKQKAELARLQGLTGQGFDREYASETTRINSQDKREDQRELNATHDPAVRSFVQTLQSADQKHYQMGQALKQQGG